MSSKCYQPNSPNVLHEVIDGEAVLINLVSGNYYSIDRIGADIWRYIEMGTSVEQLMDIVARKYDASRATIETAVNNLLADLLEQSLIIEAECQPQSITQLAVEKRQEKLPFEAPALYIYTDMAELLLLDPIHDVDETGWPKPAPEENS